MSEATLEAAAYGVVPETGMDREAIIEALKEKKANDLTDLARVYGYTYSPGGETEAVAREAYMMFLKENALDITSYPSVMVLEREVVRMIANLLRGDESVVGNMTSGGTESILLALKTARDYTRHHRPEITEPEVILPRTAHPAFHKACAYFNIKPVVIGFDTTTYKADVAEMRAAITPNTIMLVGSACGYAQGVIDPIVEIGALAKEKGLLCHVDGCVGGIHFSFMRRMGYALPDFDFTVEGVTSISADMHKYGYAPKNASIILYRDKSIRRFQIFACGLTTTYALVNPTMLSSKSGGPVAGSWATLKYMGEAGYQNLIRRLMDTTKILVDGINAIPGLRVLGQPDMCMFSFSSDEVNVFQLQYEVKKRGWYIQPQFSTPLSPPNLHISVIPPVLGNEEAFLADLRGAFEDLKASGNHLDFGMVKEQINGLIAGLSEDEAKERLQQLAGMDDDMPEDFSMVNTVIDGLSEDLRKFLLEDYVNQLFV